VSLFAGAAAGLAVLSGPTAVISLDSSLRLSSSARSSTAAGGFAWTLSSSRRIFVDSAARVIHLALFYTVTIWTAIQVGFLPFLAETGKVFAAASIYKSYTRLRSSRR